MSQAKRFRSPPEAPVVSPTTEQFKDTMAYLGSLQPLLMKHGIVKIKPPPSWKPPFCINQDKFSFKPRVQQINELEAQTRVKLEFLDKLAKFWDLQGQAFKVPMVDRKPLDMATLFKNVVAEGGLEEVTKNRKWRKICCKLSLETAVSAIKHHYEKYLYPYERFLVRENKISTPNSTPKTTPTKIGTPATANKSGTLESFPLKQERTLATARTFATATNIVGDCSHGGTKVLRFPRSSGTLEAAEGMDLSSSRTSKELRKLQFLAPGPKALLSELTPRSNSNELTMAIRRKRLASLDLDPDFSVSQPNQKVSCMGGPSTSSDSVASRTRRSRVSPKRGSHKSSSGYLELCQSCGELGHPEEVLTCCQCAASYHSHCLDPPWEGTPSPQWRCADCIAEVCNKPTEVFGFEQAKKEYTLREYLKMANKFKEDYFIEPIINPYYEEGPNTEDPLTVKIPCSVVEQEYWTVVSELDSGVIVEYGADLHSSKHGSGFPVPSKARSEEEKHYANSGWNLNNLPVLEGSVLQYIKTNISGMKVPWVYAGMCFSSFCWHTEDHWMSSINYLHRGQPKTWYGVPPSHAEALERTMKEAAPELFEAQPDLMHHLVTILSPAELLRKNIPVVRVDQCEGEFIVTGPRAYHAGFNQGFNVAEAVNFALPAWIPFGRKSVEHYSSMKRKPVFSHDELICTIAENPGNLSLSLQMACYMDLKDLVKEQEEFFQLAASLGVDPTGYERLHFESLPDQRRDCYYCHTACYVAGFRCSCMPVPDRFSCLRHLAEHDVCPPGDITIKYRFPVKELRGMLAGLQDLVNPMKSWETNVKEILSSKKEDVGILRDLLRQGRQLSQTHCYESEVVTILSNVLQEAEMCEKIAQHLMTYSVPSTNKEISAMLSFNEVKNIALKFESLPCSIRHGDQLLSCYKKVEELSLRLAIEKEIAQRTLNLGDYRVNSCTDTLHQEYIRCGVVIAVGEQLKALISLKKWCHEGRRFTTFSAEEESKLFLSDAELHLKNGEQLKAIKSLCPKVLEKHTSPLRDLIQTTLRLNDELRKPLNSTKWDSVDPVTDLLQNYKSNPFELHSGEQLIKVHSEMSEWVKLKRDFIIKNQSKLFSLHDAKSLLTKGLTLPVSLPAVNVLQRRLESVKEWLGELERMFLHPKPQASLLEVLLPRSSPSDPVFKKVTSDSSIDKSYTFAEVLSRLTSFEKAVHMIREREHRDEAFFEKLRQGNSMVEPGWDGQMCKLCAKLLFGSLTHTQCHLCLGKYHKSCLSEQAGNWDESCGYDQLFLCTNCLRSRRPLYSKVVSLYKEAHAMGIFTPEMAALGRLIFRATEWQKGITPLIVRANRVMKSGLSAPTTPTCSTPPALTTCEQKVDPNVRTHPIDLATPSSSSVSSAIYSGSGSRYCTVAVQTDSKDGSDVVRQHGRPVCTQPAKGGITCQILGKPSLPGSTIFQSSGELKTAASFVDSLAQLNGEYTTIQPSTSSQTDGDVDVESVGDSDSAFELPSSLRLELYQWRLRGAALEVHLNEMDRLNEILIQDSNLTKVSVAEHPSLSPRTLKVKGGDVIARLQHASPPSSASSSNSSISSTFTGHAVPSSLAETSPGNSDKDAYSTRVETATPSPSSSLSLSSPATANSANKSSNNNAVGVGVLRRYSDQLVSPPSANRLPVISDSDPASPMSSRRQYSYPLVSMGSSIQTSAQPPSRPASSMYQVISSPPCFQPAMGAHQVGLRQSLQQPVFVQQPRPHHHHHQQQQQQQQQQPSPSVQQRTSDYMSPPMKRMAAPQDGTEVVRPTMLMMMPGQLCSPPIQMQPQNVSQMQHVHHTPPSLHQQPAAQHAQMLASSHMSPVSVNRPNGGVLASMTYPLKRSPSPLDSNNPHGLVHPSKMSPPHAGIHVVPHQPMLVTPPPISSSVTAAAMSGRYHMGRNVMLFPQSSHRVQSSPEEWRHPGN